MQLPYVLFHIWKLKEKHDLEVDNDFGGTGKVLRIRKLQ